MKQQTLKHLTQAAAFLATACASAQAPFSLDTTFRTDIQQQYVNSLLLVPDGKVIASGMMRFPGEFSDKRLVRLLPDGQRDETFYNSGLGGGGIKPWQADRFYVQGSYSPRRIWLVSGQTDNSFAMGAGAVPFFAPLQGGDYHVYPDGRVLVSGTHTLSDAARGFVGNYNLIWFSNTGYLDTTRVHRRGNGSLSKLKELPDGGFIVSGTCSQFDGVAVDRVFRTDADGVPDTTFRSGVFWGSANDYLPLPDGRVYLCGRYRSTHAPDDSLHVARFLPDGSLDPSFAIPHFTLGELPNYANLGPLAVRIRPWGGDRLLVTGQFQYVNGLPRRGICVMDTTGAITEEFDDCGVGTFTYMGLTNAGIIGLVADTDSTHYYVWGTYTGYDDGVINDTQQRFVSRLHVGDFTTGGAPLSLGEGPGVRVYPNPSSGSATLQLDQVPRDAQVVLRDALGREVLRQRIRDHYTLLYMTQGGVYTLEVLSDGERVSTQRLVVE